MTGQFNSDHQTIVTAEQESDTTPRLSLMPHSQAQTGRKISTNHSPLRFKQQTSTSRNEPISYRKTLSSGRKTVFCQQYSDLLDQIRQKYPDWDENCPQKLDNNLRSTDSFPATQVFSQLQFLFKKAKSPSTLRDDRELDTLMNDQAHVAQNMMKYQFENNQRETEFFKKQVEVMKNQQIQSDERAQ